MTHLSSLTPRVTRRISRRNRRIGALVATLAAIIAGSVPLAHAQSSSASAASQQLASASSSSALLINPKKKCKVIRNEGRGINLTFALTTHDDNRDGKASLILDAYAAARAHSPWRNYRLTVQPEEYYAQRLKPGSPIWLKPQDELGTLEIRTTYRAPYNTRTSMTPQGSWTPQRTRLDPPTVMIPYKAVLIAQRGSTTYLVDKFLMYIEFEHDKTHVTPGGGEFYSIGVFDPQGRTRVGYRVTTEGSRVYSSTTGGCIR